MIDSLLASAVSWLGISLFWCILSWHSDNKMNRKTIDELARILDRQIEINGELRKELKAREEQD